MRVIFDQMCRCAYKIKGMLRHIRTFWTLLKENTLANHFLDLGYPLQEQALDTEWFLLKPAHLQGIHERIVPFQHSFHADFQRQFSDIFVY